MKSGGWSACDRLPASSDGSPADREALVAFRTLQLPAIRSLLHATLFETRRVQVTRRGDPKLPMTIYGAK